MYGWNQGPPQISSEENTAWERMMSTKTAYPYYVVMRDKFFSGWGGARARGAVYVYGCRSVDEAKIVTDNAKRRGDQDGIRTLTHPPHINPTTTRLKFMEPEGSHTNWYKPNFRFEG